MYRSIDTGNSVEGLGGVCFFFKYLQSLFKMSLPLGGIK